MALLSKLLRLDPITVYYTSDPRRLFSAEDQGPFHPSLDDPLPPEATFKVSFHSPLLYFTLLKYAELRFLYAE